MKTASDRAKEINARNPHIGFRLVEDASFWAESGVHTGDDLDRCLAIQTFSDSYKEAHGFRPHYDLSKLSTDELEELTAEL